MSIEMKFRVSPKTFLLRFHFLSKNISIRLEPGIVLKNIQTDGVCFMMTGVPFIPCVPISAKPIRSGFRSTFCKKMEASGETMPRNRLRPIIFKRKYSENCSVNNGYRCEKLFLKTTKNIPHYKYALGSGIYICNSCCMDNSFI